MSTVSPQYPLTFCYLTRFRAKIKMNWPPLPLQVIFRSWSSFGMTDDNRACPGYKVAAAKSADEYAQLDANDESLNRWKASLGIVPGATAVASGPKASSTD